MFSFDFLDNTQRIQPNHLTTMATVGHRAWNTMVFELRVDNGLDVTRKIVIADGTFEKVGVDCTRYDDGRIDCTLWLSSDIAEYCLKYYEQYEGAFMIGGRTIAEGLKSWRILWEKREMRFGY